MPFEGETRAVGNGMGTYKMINGKLVFRITSMDSNKGKDNENMKKLREARASKNNYSKLTQKTVRLAIDNFFKNQSKTQPEESISREKVNEEIIANKIYSQIDFKKLVSGKKVYKKRTSSPKYKKGSEEAKEVMKRLREAKEKKRLERKDQNHNIEN